MPKKPVNVESRAKRALSKAEKLRNPNVPTSTTIKRVREALDNHEQPSMLDVQFLEHVTGRLEW